MLRWVQAWKPTGLITARHHDAEEFTEELNKYTAGVKSLLTKLTLVQHNP